MAARKQKKSNGKVAASTPTPAGDENPEKPAPLAANAAKRAAGKKTAKKRAARRAVAKRGPGRPKGSKNKKRTVAKAAVKRGPKKGAAPKRYTPAERAKILAAAKREGLSGPAAAKKFGISQLTFYTWRKKGGAGTKRNAGRPRTAVRSPRSNSIESGVADAMRREVRSRIDQMLPEIIRTEIDNALDSGKRDLRRG